MDKIKIKRDIRGLSVPLEVLEEISDLCELIEGGTVEYSINHTWENNGCWVSPEIENYSNKFGNFQRASLPYTFMKMTRDISYRSTCIRKKVGCLIVPNDYTNINSIGYNGSNPGEENGCKSIGSGKCGCVHAEVNALNKFRPERGMTYTVLTTLSPCLSCSMEISKYSQINTVIYLKPYKVLDGVNFLRGKGILVKKWEF
jgi:dCMP deaminase